MIMVILDVFLCDKLPVVEPVYDRYNVHVFIDNFRCL